MENYPANIRNGIHTVSIILQSENYKGEVQIEIGGNTRGVSTLNYIDEDGDWLEEGMEFMKNDCDLRTLEDDYGDYWFNCKLKDEDGNTLEIEDEIEFLKDYIVGVNIIKFEFLEEE